MAPKKTNNESTDRGMFHNSNKHCLGFITSSTHPSSICLGCCHLMANSPVRLVSSQLSPPSKVLALEQDRLWGDPQPTVKAHAPCFRPGVPMRLC